MTECVCAGCMCVGHAFCAGLAWANGILPFAAYCGTVSVVSLAGLLHSHRSWLSCPRGRRCADGDETSW
jgi:hypothetical protein